jgi:hypothetical protein
VSGATLLEIDWTHMGSEWADEGGSRLRRLAQLLELELEGVEVRAVECARPARDEAGERVELCPAAAWMRALAALWAEERAARPRLGRRPRVAPGERVRIISLRLGETTCAALCAYAERHELRSAGHQPALSVAAREILVAALAGEDEAARWFQAGGDAASLAEDQQGTVPALGEEPSSDMLGPDPARRTAHRAAWMAGWDAYAAAAAAEEVRS